MGRTPLDTPRPEQRIRQISQQVQRPRVCPLKLYENTNIYTNTSSFDVIELSSGFLSFPADDWLRLVDKVHSYKLKAKPELGIQFGAGGDTAASDLETIGTSDSGKLVDLGHRFLNAGVERLMIESEGITENVASWRTDVVSTIMKQLPPERVMFEAADPKVYNWYIREFGVYVNLFVDHSQIVQLSCLRQGIWGMADTFGKVVSFRPE